MLRGVTFRQFCEWRAYADMEPFDESRGDLRAAQIVATLLNLHSKKGARLITVDDVVLRFDSSKPQVAGSTPGETVEKQRKQIRSVMDMLRSGQAGPKQAASTSRKRA